MATKAKLQANYVNAQKSTGPRTPEGKAKSSQNALKHGLFARETVIRGEDEGEFAEYREGLLNQLIPGSPLEEMLANRIVDLSWRLQRAARDQSDAFAALYEKYVAAQAAEPGSASGAGILPVNSNHEQDAHATNAPAEPGMIGRMILEDFSRNGVLERLLRYERRIENSLYRTLKEMRGVFDQRQKAAQEQSSILARWKEEDWEAKKARMFAPRPPGAASPGPAGPTRNIPRAEGSHPVVIPPWQGAGLTPDAPPEDKTCQTNPISEEVLGVKRQVSGETCKTNPIGGLDERQVLCGQEVTRILPQGGAAQATPEEASYRLVHCVGRPAVRS